MKDRKMANLPPSKYKLASIIERRTNTWREDEYTNIKSVDTSVMQVNHSYFKTPSGENYTAAWPCCRKTFWNFHSHSPTIVARINFQLLKNKYRNLQYENDHDSLDGIEQVDKPSTTCICCRRPIFFFSNNNPSLTIHLSKVIATQSFYGSQ